MWNSDLFTQVSLTAAKFFSLNSSSPLLQYSSSPYFCSNTSDSIGSLPSPWDHSSCNHKFATKYCTYTSTSFSHGRGLSILTKPDIAAIVETLPDIAIPQPPPTTLQGPPPYEIKQLPGKGMGVIANRTIQRGELLFAAPIIAIYHNELLLNLETSELPENKKLFHRSIENLPERTRGMFWEAADQEEYGDRVLGKIHTNTFLAHFGGEAHRFVLFPYKKVALLWSGEPTRTHILPY